MHLRTLLIVTTFSSCTSINSGTSQIKLVPSEDEEVDITLRELRKYNKDSKKRLAKVMWQLVKVDFKYVF